MLTIRMLAHPSIGPFREEPGCVAFISRNNVGRGASEPDTAALGLKRARRHATGTEACVHSRDIARIGYHRNVRGGAARLPIHP